MDDLVQLFQKQTRRKADADLIARWEFHIRYQGDKDIKPQAAQARRVATQLDKACNNFTNLAPEQQLAFKAAANGMRKLATDLSALALWAKDYSVFYQTEKKKIRNVKHTAQALERWGERDEKFDFECKIICELRTHDGEASFIDWLKAQPAFSAYESKRIIPPFNNFPKNPDSMCRIDVMQFLAESHTHRRTFSDGYAHASTEDYEDYLKYRLDIERLAAASIEQAKAKQTLVK